MKVASGKMISNLKRPAICTKPGTAHMDVGGRCFFCGEKTVVEHNDIIKVVTGKKVA